MPDSQPGKPDASLRRRARIAAAVAAILCSVPGASASAQAASVTPPQRVALTELEGLPRAGRLNRLRFDAQGVPRLDEAPLGRAICAASTPEQQRRVLLLDPRVDQVECAGASGQAPTRMLVGLDAEGKLLWQHRLGFVSGSAVLEEQVLGATADGIVLDNLSVIAARTGEVVRTPSTHPEGEDRHPVPDILLRGSAIYLPEPKAFLWFAAEVTRQKREGGLHWIDASGPAVRPRLISRVRIAMDDAFWRVESMASLDGGKQVVLGQRLGKEGEPGPVAVSVLDTRTGEESFREEYGNEHVCEDVQVRSDASGRLAFSYADRTREKRIVMEYRVRPNRPR